MREPGPEFCLDWSAASWRSSRIIDLLRDIAADGFPADYLIARIRARRARLVSDWQARLVEDLPPGTSDESIWEALLQELDWLYRQMDRRLRKSFADVFLLFELKTVVLCLRNKAAERPIVIDALLERSLLADPLRRILRREPGVPSTVAALSEGMATTTVSFRELERAYAEEGLKGFENSLVQIVLERIAETRPHRVIETFFATFIDLRNIMILHKALRWGVQDVTPFISGGGIDRARFRRALERRDSAELEALVKRATGPKAIAVASDQAVLEAALLRGMTEKLRRLGRESDDIGLILDYVWRCYAQARNLALLYHGRDLEVETLEKELIL